MCLLHMFADNQKHIRKVALRALPSADADAFLMMFSITCSRLVCISNILLSLRTVTKYIRYTDYLLTLIRSVTHT